MIRRPPRSTHCISSAASDVYKRQHHKYQQCDFILLVPRQQSQHKLISFVKMSQSQVITHQRTSSPIVVRSTIQNQQYYTKVPVQTIQQLQTVQNMQPVGTVKVLKQVPFYVQQVQPIQYKVSTPTKTDNKEYEFLIMQLRNEIEEYKARIGTFEQHKCKNEENQKLVLQITELTNENQRLLKICESMQAYELKIQEYKETITMKQKEIEDYKTIISQYSFKIESVKQENQGKDKLIAEIQKEIDGTKKVQVEQLKRSELQYQRSKEQYEKEMRESTTLNDKLQQQILEIQTKYDKLCQENQQNVALLTQEIDKLNAFIKSKQVEIDSIKMQLSSSEQDASKLSGLLNEIENLRSAIEAKDEELEGWVARSNQQQVKIDQLTKENAKIIDYEGKIQLVSSEYDRQKQVNKQQKMEIEELKSKLNQQESQIIELQRYESQCKQSQDQIKVLVSECENLQELHELRLNEIKQLKDTNQKLTVEVEKLQPLENDNQRLSQNLTATTKELEELKSLTQRQDLTISDLKKNEFKIAEQEKIIEYYTKEIQVMQTNLNQKIQEVENWRSQFTQQKQQYEKMLIVETELKKLRELYSQSQNEVDQYRKKGQSLEIEVTQTKKKCEELLVQLNIVNGDNTNLRGWLQRSNDQIQGLKQSLTITEMTAIDLQKSRDRIEELERIIQNKDTEVNKYRDSISAILQELEKTKTYILQVEGDKSMFQIEIRRLADLLESKKKENDELRIRAQGQDNKIIELSQIQYLNLELESQIKQLKAETEKKDTIIMSKIQEIEQLYQRTTTLETQLGSKFILEDKINLLNGELERILHENKLLIKELDDNRYQYSQYSLLADKYNDLMADYVLTSSVIESLKQMYAKKDQEYQDYRRSTIGSIQNTIYSFNK
eukprot:TRINITY_DN74_c0_g1_i1.p1 TRINITY_DN74_c0_g1~~TRINITY_DN74_c0_g1_i1.p1  ORF type:complete len:894 (+),score=216.24 TRINITY_DN74_c0_g1_i1:144-2825(+)